MDWKITPWISNVFLPFDVKSNHESFTGTCTAMRVYLILSKIQKIRCLYQTVIKTGRYEYFYPQTKLYINNFVGIFMKIVAKLVVISHTRTLIRPAMHQYKLVITFLVSLLSPCKNLITDRPILCSNSQ